jgi:hypothetical protein
MRKNTKILALTAVVAAAGWFAGCNGTIDKEPNVVLELETLTIPPVTSSANGTNGACTYTITMASGTFKNKPKNQFAGVSPFNDIILKNLVITYGWDDGVAQPAVTAGLAGAVPADGSTSAQFTVVSNGALTVDGPNDPAGTGRAGHTASLGLTFNGTTVSGDAVSTTTGGTLQINSCTVNLGACCGGVASAGCTDGLSAQACTGQGGVYQGDFTTCATLPNSCP